MTGLIGALDESNSGIQGLVTAAANTLGAVEQNLETVAGKFSDSTMRVSDSIHASTRLLEGKADRLSTVSGETLQQIATIVGRFDDHSKVLGQASDLLSAAQSNLVTTLEEREDALQALAVGLVHRSEEIENTMRSLAGLVEAAFDRAESRSGQVSTNLKTSVQASFADIGGILADTEKRAAEMAETMKSAVTGAAQDVSAAVEASLGKANERAEDVAGRLRASVTNSLADVDRLLGETGKRSISTASQMREALKEAVQDAVNRFAGATEEIRRTAGDIRKELSETRADLKRGAFDLPEEAKESAAQMRRAVAEQVKALQELSGIIGVSSAHLETPRRQEIHRAPSGPTATREPEPVVHRQPVMAAVAPPQVVEPAPARVEQPVQKQAVPQQPILRQESVERRPAEPAPAPAEPAGLRGSLGIERQQPAQPRERPAETPRLSEGQGWISDLLRNASMEDDEPAPRRAATAQPTQQADSRNPRHVVESLNSLSVDIARAIDHDASVELWRRYQRGERDVFTRRLYTLKGQQTFDEIKRKYDNESEFRLAVDRYIDDFEKLLADVARNDRDRVLTQSYLTSDTGKVYTMLAHAAGRFS